jgi:hypothetical protein
MRTLYASLPPAEGNALAMPARENDDELTLSYGKTLLLLDLSVIRAQGYAATVWASHSMKDLDSVLGASQE